MGSNGDELECLRRQLKEVTAERDRLLAENRRLRDGYPRSPQESGQMSLPLTSAAPSSFPIATEPVPSYPGVNNDSPLPEKVKLFRLMFRGREDVFARLWCNRKSHKIGYSPVCHHAWNPMLCGKPKVRCGNCPNRDFVPVTDGVIQDHLEGGHTIGIYPLLPDETCYLLAIDLDKRSWMEDAAAFLETCRGMDIPAALERSRSGSGAHVWIFFSEAVSASAARKLGCYLLTETMTHRHQLGMDSYDRLFPNQDTLPKGALPGGQSPDNL